MPKQSRKARTKYRARQTKDSLGTLAGPAEWLSGPSAAVPLAVKPRSRLDTNVAVQRRAIHQWKQIALITIFLIVTLVIISVLIR